MDIGDDTGCPGACRDARDPMPPLASQTRCVYDYGDTPGGREQLLPKPLACAVGDDGWLLHDHARLHRRSHRESDHHGPATHRLRHRGLGDQRLSAGLRGANAGGRPAWRPVRPEESLPDWPGGIHRCVAGVRSVERCRHADCRSSGARRRRRIAYPADAVDDNADLPGSSPRCRAGRMGHRRQCRQPGGTVGRRRAGRQHGVGVDFLRQRSRRRHRPDPGGLSDSGTTPPPASVRLVRRRIVWCGNVSDCLRTTAGPVRQLAALDLGGDRRRYRVYVAVRLLAGAERPRAADPTGGLQRPELQLVQPRDSDHRLRGDGDDAAGDVLCAGGVWVVADPHGRAVRADGDRRWRAGPVRRHDH
ncbi:MFS drug transporter [Mycobacterium tuberculosis variant bovis BCG]|nr:MFS drug transporter [Mycobacterium tuberculosis variant bovis BCG]SGO47488.1 drug:H+ antiporter-2 (14 Spanner) (DHA2) family drug resistance MFS transporter [Mycobacterium tuberculosis]